MSNRLSEDVRAECQALDAFLAAHLAEFGRRTVFYDWTVADQVMHLHQVDLFGLLSMRDPDGFVAEVARIRAQQARGMELSQLIRESFGHLDAPALLETWRAAWQELCDLFDRSDPKARMKWFGPEMSIRSFAAARQMEVWAHGQDIYDLLQVRRPATAQIRNICELGVRTFGWSFSNRGEAAPEARVRVSLAGPDGARWIWNPDGKEAVEGTAEDFALVVTQRRHVEDTALHVTGASARRWMEIAQCFAGKPAIGPAPGVRRVRYG